MAERFGAETLDEDGRSRYDVVVVGAGAAGLSAALVLGRSGRKVLVLDGGEPRNAPAEASHGFFTRDGVHPGEMLRIGREQLGPYPDVEYRSGRATDASGTDGAFEVALEDGEVVAARKLVLATGVVDELPERPGFRELWGKGVYHCPYCHGWEVRDKPLAVLARPGAAFERVALIRNWSRDLALLTDGEGGLSEDDRKKLDALSVPVYEEKISRLEGDPARPGGGLAGSLGCELSAPVPTVEFVKADPMTRETTVAGVYSVGDTVAGPGQSVVLASASGAAAAYVLNHALAVQDAEDEVAAATSVQGDLGRAAG